MMKDKMSISSNNQSPKEFTEYLHNLIEEIIVKGESFDKYKKWLKKYCDEYSVDYNDIETEIIDFVELATEFAKTGNSLIEKMFHKAAFNLYITTIQSKTFIKKIKSKKNKTKKDRPKKKQEEYCAFCGRPKVETDLLVLGIHAAICNHCIDQASQLLKEEFNN